ncbi:hypothetical protein [Piscibacillus salipiscarius]
MFDVQELLKTLKDQHREELINYQQRQDAKLHYIDFINDLTYRLHQEFYNLSQATKSVRVLNEDDVFSLHVNEKMLRLYKFKNINDMPDKIMVIYTNDAGNQGDELFIDEGVYRSSKFYVELSDELIDHYIDHIFQN